jgi:hypothetical protein
MSKQAQQSLGADLKDQQDKQGQKKRKMTAAILEEQEKQKEKESHVIFEDDDDFEEFEINNEHQAADVDMDGGAEARQVWQMDWDDESV